MFLLFVSGILLGVAHFSSHEVAELKVHPDASGKVYIWDENALMEKI